MRSFLVLSFCCSARAKFTANDKGAAQELKGSGTTSKDVCEGRSDHCSVLLDVPSTCAGTTTACPVVLMFHGHGGNNEGFEKQQATVHDYDMIGVYPQGELYDGSSGWNDGSMKGLECAYDDYTCTKDPNDGLFVSGIVSALQELGATGRFYGFGGSNGANEVQILASNACDALPFVGIAADSGQLLANPSRSAGAPYDYNQPCAGSQPCTGGRAVAQLSIHGTADPVIPYDGGSRFQSPVFILMQEDASDKIWAEQNNCTGSLSSTTVPATASGGQSTTAVHHVWGGCPATAPVEYYEVKDAGHVATHTIDGKNKVAVVFEFFAKVESAYQSSIVV